MPSQIDIEARLLARTSIDCDKFRRRYRQKDPDNNITVSFVSPVLGCLEKHRFFLLKNSVKEVLKRNHYYRPDYLSYEKYGTTVCWYILMFINNISCIEEFNVYDVFIPSYFSILQLAKENESSIVTDIPLDVVQPFNLKPYVTKQTIPEFSAYEGEGYVSNKYWVRQLFTISASQASNGYVDLLFDAIPESVNIKVDNAGNFIYGEDYIIKLNDSSELKRLSWNSTDLSGGSGLLGTIVTGTKVEVSYAKLKEEEAQ